MYKFVLMEILKLGSYLISTVGRTYLVGWDSINADHITHTTRILLIGRVIEPLGHREPKFVHLHGH